MEKYHRGERRYQRRRLFQRHLAQNLNHRLLSDASEYLGNRAPVSKDSWEYRNAQARTVTGTLCSCTTCASERKLFGNGKQARTRQEQQAIQRLDDTE